VANTLRLLRLPREALNALGTGEISEGHARALLICPLETQQLQVLERVRRESLSVRQTENLARRLGRTPDRDQLRRAAPLDADLAAIETRLRETLGTKVELRGGPAGGRLVIHYYSDEELDALLDRFLPEPNS
jgi:ParB family chromosome partitioning protein